MIKLRVMTTAYLVNDDELLMMERSKERRFAPGIWAGVGGHLEPEEINNPYKACIREIYEETGIEEEYISGLNLKYMILRRSKEEIRVQYVYIGNALKRKVKNTNEGNLYWISKDNLFEKELSVTTQMTLKHYLEYGSEIRDIMVGAVSADNNKPAINWIPLQDWEGI